MKMLSEIVVFGIIQFQIELSKADFTCTNWDYSSNYHYCEHGCCDSWPHETCCSDDTWVGWAIAGGIIGGILIISLVACVVCACMKHKGKTGRVIQPNSGQNQPPAYAPSVAYLSYPYPQSQVAFPPLPAYTSDPSAPPPPYQSVYGQQPPPPLPVGLQNQENYQVT